VERGGEPAERANSERKKNRCILAEYKRGDWEVTGQSYYFDEEKAPKGVTRMKQKEKKKNNAGPGERKPNWARDTAEHVPHDRTLGKGGPKKVGGGKTQILYNRSEGRTGRLLQLRRTRLRQGRVEGKKKGKILIGCSLEKEKQGD